MTQRQYQYGSGFGPSRLSARTAACRDAPMTARREQKNPRREDEQEQDNHRKVLRMSPFFGSQPQSLEIHGQGGDRGRKFIDL